MQVFEFHFNPPHSARRAKNKDDLIFDSFCYEPENIYEKRLGSLYMAGLLRNILPQKTRFLDALSKTIKDNFYKTAIATPEKSLKGSLKKTNEFLEKIARAGDVSWLGNLNFAVISLIPCQKPWWRVEINFAKVGDLKIFLLRNGQIVDIDKNLKLDDIEPYPLKIFGNIISGKLAENDIILVLTKEVFNAFLEEKLLDEIADISLSASMTNELKKLKQILNSKKDQLSKIYGICLLIALTKENFTKERENYLQSKGLKIFSFKEIFRPLIKILKFPKLSLKLKAPKIKFKFSKPKLIIPQLKIKKIRIPSFKGWKVSKFLNKKLTLILALILVLIAGFFIFKKMEEKQLKIYQEKVNQIQEKVNQGKAYLLIADKNLQAKKSANSLLKDAWEEISILADISFSFPSSFSNEILNLKNDISENLFKINKFVGISEPEIIFEFNPREYIPQKIISLNGNVYLFSSYSENVFEVDNKNGGKLLSVAKKFNSATALGNSLLFFSKPNVLINLRENQFGEPMSLETPYPDFNFNNLSSYQSNLYFLDNQNGKIIKYPYFENLKFGPPQSWLSSKTKNAADFRSMTVDGSVWILTKNNSIQRYYAGYLQESLNLDIFPLPKDLTKIFALSQDGANSYLYLLEPIQKRIIILNKSGQIIKQFQSEKFDNLLDFSVSADGKKIYLLNGLKVYQIKI